MPKVTQLLHSRVEMQTRLCATHSIDIQKIPGMISPHTVLCLPGSLVPEPVPGPGYFSSHTLPLPCTYQTILGSSCSQNAAGSTIFSEGATGL